MSRSACQHRLAVSTPSVWDAQIVTIGAMHDDEEQIHLELGNCRHCDSTIARPLPGHVEDEVT